MEDIKKEIEALKERVQLLEELEGLKKKVAALEQRVKTPIIPSPYLPFPDPGKWRIGAGTSLRLGDIMYF